MKKNHNWDKCVKFHQVYAVCPECKCPTRAGDAKKIKEKR